jgi:hypothetical protein
VSSDRASDPGARLLASQRANNRSTAGAWETFADHRAQTTALALEAAGPRVAVLGAGNCNDLDLAALATRAREIHLVDLDAEALGRARDRQDPDVARTLSLHAPLDLTGGALARIAAFGRKPPTDVQLDPLPDSSADAVVAALPGRFDTVLSACVLTQLLHACHAALGEGHPAAQDAAFAVALGHLRAMARLTAPGGTAVLVTDAISSATYPLDELWGSQEPLALLRALEAGYNVFSFTASSLLRRTLIEDEVIAPLLERPRLVEPWLWHLGPDATLLAYAMVCRARG